MAEIQKNERERDYIPVLLYKNERITLDLVKDEQHIIFRGAGIEEHVKKLSKSELSKPNVDFYGEPLTDITTRIHRLYPAYRFMNRDNVQDYLTYRAVRDEHSSIIISSQQLYPHEVVERPSYYFQRYCLKVPDRDNVSEWGTTYIHRISWDLTTMEDSNKLIKFLVDEGFKKDESYYLFTVPDELEEKLGDLGINYKREDAFLLINDFLKKIDEYNNMKTRDTRSLSWSLYTLFKR